MKGIIMKKTLSVLTATLLAVSLAGCGGGKKEAPKASQASATASIPVLKYKIIDTVSTSIPGRERQSVKIALVNPGKDASKQSIAATCISAAKFIAKGNSAKFIGVNIWDEKTGKTNRYGGCEYAVDGKGISGNDSWTWRASATDDIKAPLPSDVPVTPELENVQETVPQI